jgi:hypothetical protein
MIWCSLNLLIARKPLVFNGRVLREAYISTLCRGYKRRRFHHNGTANRTLSMHHERHSVFDEVYLS